MIDTSKSLIYNGSKKVDAMYKGSSATPMYTWEEKEVVVGLPERIPHGTNIINNSSLLKWEGYLTSGSDGYRLYYGQGDIINGRQVGEATNVYSVITSQPTNAVNVIGTKTLSSYKKSTKVNVGGYASTSEYPVRKQIAFSDYKWPVGSEVVVAYRVTGGGLNNSNTSGQIRFKQEGANTVSLINFTAIIDKTDIDSLGNPLCIVIATMSTSSITHYAEYIDLFFEQNISNIYDVNVYLEAGELGPVNIAGEPVAHVSSSVGRYYYYQPWTEEINPNKQYVLKTKSPSSASTSVYLYSANSTNAISARIAIIPAGGQVTLMGSELLYSLRHRAGIGRNTYYNRQTDLENSNIIEVWG